MRTGDLGCGSRFVLMAIAVVFIIAACGCGLQTTEWKTIHEGVLSGASVAGGQYPYLNIEFGDGFSIPMYYLRFEGPIGWTTGERYVLQERKYEGNTRYRLMPSVPLKAEAEPSAPK